MDQKPRKRVHNICTFYGAYEDFKEEAMIYGGRTWNSETIKQYDAIVQNHIVPYLKDHDRKHIGQFHKQDYPDMTDRPRFEGGPFACHVTDLRQFGLRFLMYDILDTIIAGGNTYGDNFRKK